MKAKIVDLTPTTLTIEITDRPERVRQLLDMVEPYGIVELARTGTVALEKGAASAISD